ncbi:MBL fold metallo-hydrolase [Porticoccaceae bacterium LTM1]|nr:MBL fold metallo-hydrolase [Porticoccaceae bacterium LTM1]
MVKFRHHGAVTGVTGSCHELVLDSQSSVLIDCGLFQGAESAGRELGEKQIDFPLDTLKALFVTHCHIDHIGRIPWLLAAGFTGPVFASEATVQLLPLVIEDALKVGVTRNDKLIKAVLSRLKRQLVPVPYGEWGQCEVVPGLRYRFNRAGHILGSAYIEFEWERERIVFSGDLGPPYTPLLPSPKSPWRADYLVIESTYGDRLHEQRRERRRNLERVVRRCLKDAGTVLIPAFSIGRTQELLYELEDILGDATDDLAQLDIIVDSPLAAKFTRHYRRLSQLWDEEARRRLSQGRHPLSFDQLITIDTHSQHQKLVNHLAHSGRPAVVIAASGMCAGGRIVNYLKALLPDSRTDVLFVGYQAVGTPGRDIQKYGPSGGYVELDGERIDIRAGVHTLSGYSAHADQKDLVNFVKRIRRKPKQVRVVHGSDEAKQELARLLVPVLEGGEVVIPAA